MTIETCLENTEILLTTIREAGFTVDAYQVMHDVPDIPEYLLTSHQVPTIQVTVNLDRRELLDKQVKA